MMQKSQKRQWIVLAAMALTLALGAGFTYSQSTHPMLIWPIAMLLGLVWGAIGLGLLGRGAKKSRKPKAESGN